MENFQHSAWHMADTNGVAFVVIISITIIIIIIIWNWVAGTKPAQSIRHQAAPC